MAAATTKEALEWLAAETGRNVVRDRPELLTILNDIRRFFYVTYDKLKLDFWLEGCFAVQEFYDPCDKCNGAPLKYLGITLPAEMNQVEQMRLSGIPVTIHNRWVNYMSIPAGGSSVKSADMGGDFPTQLDWDPSKCVRPVFMATDPKDCGKTVTISFFDANNNRSIEHIPLSLQGSQAETEVRQFVRPGGIVLPVDLCGPVVAYDCLGGETIGYYGPKTAVPSFRRIRIIDGCCGEVVWVKATRRFTEVCFDWEVIETDNKLAIIEAQRYLKIMAVNSADAQWLAMARTHMANVEQYIGGGNFRDDGATSVRKITLFQKPLRKSRLNHAKRRF